MSFSKLGSQHTVNTTIDGDQSGSAVVQLLNGDIVVAWTDTNGGAVNVRGQILNADGVTKDGSEFMLNTTLSGDQFDVALTALGNGGFAAGWTSSADWQPPFDLLEAQVAGNDGYQNHIVTQVFAADGATVGGEETHSLFIYDYSFREDYLLPEIELTEYLQSAAALTANLAIDSDGFDIIAVDEVHYTDYVQIWTPFVTTWNNYEGGENNIVKFSDGDAEILNNQAEDITYAFAHYVNVGLPTDPPGYPDLDKFHDPKAITLTDGTVVTAYWREANASNLGGVHVDISTEASTVRMGSGDSNSPDIAELENGNLIVVWTDDINSEDGLDDIRAQILTASGGKIGGEFAVTSATNSQWTPAVAALTDGRFIVVWEDLAGDGSGSAIKGQVFTEDGVKSGEAFTVNTSTAEDQRFPTVTALANGDAFVTWTDNFGETSDIYSQVLDLQTYVGDSSAETVYGGTLDDHLDGGDGADALHGGGGDDVFENVTLDDLNDGDVFDGEAGIDTLDFDEYLVGAGNSTILIGGNGSVSGVEIINLHGSSLQAGFNLVRLAIPLANSSSTGNVTVNGGLMADFVYGDSIGNSEVSLFLNGKEGNDTLYGGAGDDTLSGGEGDDQMVGRGGDDIYLVDSLDDTVTEVSGLQPIFARGDLVIASIGYTLGPDLENLALSGTANLRGTGNDVGNEIAGNSGSNNLFGLGGNDTLYGEAGDDELDGGTGADGMEGGEGDDVYVVDNIGDVVTEIANEGDADLIMSSLNIGLSAHVENLILTGTGNLAGVGNFRDNIMAGNAGNNALTGVTGDDYLYGLGGNDVLWGGQGGDTLDGGAGLLDTAIYTGSSAFVHVMLGTGGLVFGGDATGDTLTDIENLVGSAYDDILVGFTGSNVLAGAGGNDTLAGAEGDNSLIGGLGLDTHRGGGGNDTFDFNSTDESPAFASGGGFGADILLDFDDDGTGAGGAASVYNDLIDLAAADANEQLAGDQAFFLDDRDGVNETGELIISSTFDATGQQVSFLFALTDGDLNADFAIQFDRLITTFGTGDFVL